MRIEQIRFRLPGHVTPLLRDRVFQQNRPVADVRQKVAGHFTVLRSLEGEPHSQLPISLAPLSSSFGAAVQIIWQRCPTRWLLAEYRCPAGKALRCDRRKFTVPRSGVTKADTIIYRASANDCKGCPLKMQCCPNTPMRKIARQLNESARDVARQLSKTPRYARSRRHRKKVEMLFAHLKRILRLDRLRLRGLKGARDEFLLAATVQNLRRMAAWLMPKGPESGIAAPI